MTNQKRSGSKFSSKKYFSRSRAAYFEALESRFLLSGATLDQLLPSSQSLLGEVSANGFSTAGATGGMTPTQIRNAYGIDQINFSGISGDGTGQTIAIVDAAHYSTDTTGLHSFSISGDLDSFDQNFKIDGSTLTLYQQYGMASTLLTVHEMTSGLTYDASWAGEIALDVEWAHSVAPAAKIVLVVAADETSLNAAVSYAAAQTGVSVVSMSYGGPETSSGELTEDATFTTPVGHTGVTFLSSTGDTGGYAPPATTTTAVTDMDIGSTGATGGATIGSNGEVLTQTGAGAFGTTTDSFNYLATTYSGDGVFIAQISSLNSTVSGARAGIMIRNTTLGSSINVAVLETPTGVQFQYRSATSGFTTVSGSLSITPVEVAIVRAGSNFTAYATADGATWTQVGSTVSIVETPSLYYGTVVCSGINGTTLTSTFGAGHVASSSAAAVQYQATSPNVVAVGGTYLTLDGSGNYSSETAWGNGALSYVFGGSGGGTSLYETHPSYQSGSGNRSVPDVSFAGGTPVTIYDDFSSSSLPWNAVWGTSFSAPVWGALIAIADQGRAYLGLGTLTSADTLKTLYDLPKTDFNDVTSGSNGVNSAAAGYDKVTGLGTPKAQLLVPDLVGWVFYTPAANNDTITVELDGTNPSKLDIIEGGVTTQFTASQVSGLEFTVGSDNETITLDDGNGSITLNHGISVQGSGNVSLIFTGGNFTYSGNYSNPDPHLSVEAAGGATVNVANGQFLSSLIIDSGTAVTITGNFAPGSITDNGLLSFNAVNLTLAANISGTGSLNINGSLTLSGNNTYSGGTVLNGGDLTINSDSQLGTAPSSPTTNITIEGNSELIFGSSVTLNSNRGIAINAGAVAFIECGTNSVEIDGVFSGSGEFIQAGSGILTLGGNNLFTGITFYSGTLTLANSFALGNSTVFAQAGGGTLSFGSLSSATFGNLYGDGNIFLGSVALTVGGNGSGNQIFSGTLSGTGSLTKVGTATLTLSGANTYSGLTSVSAGTLLISGAKTNGTSSIASGAILQIGNGGTTGSIAGAITDNGSLIADNSALTISTVISGSGELVKEGTGTLTLSGTNTYSGGTIISGGILVIGGDSKLGATTSTITFDGNSTLRFGAAFTLNASRSIILDIGVVGTLDTNGNSVTFAGSISGAGNFTKAGSGTLTLGGNNTFTGDTSILAGTLSLGTGNLSLSNSTLDYESTGGTFSFGSVTTATFGGLEGNKAFSLGSVKLTVGNNGNSTIYSGVLSGTGNLTKTGSGVLTLTGNNTYSGTTALSAGTMILTGTNGNGARSIASGTTLQIGAGGSTGNAGTSAIADDGNLIIDRSGTLTISNAISGAGSLIQMGSGTVTLSGSNTFAGGTILNAGILVVNSDARLGASTGNIEFTGNATLQYAAAFALSSSRNIILDSGIIGVIDTQAFSVTIASAISGAGGLGKQGTGTLTLTGNNTYTGGNYIYGGSII